MQVIKTLFGQYQNQDIDLYELQNNNGMSVKISNYGATITSISMLDEKGNRVELACGFNTLEGYFSEAYKKNAPYFGCTVGRYASRIKGGKFSIDGEDYTLAVNDGSNHLHGGLVGFDKKIWEAEIIELDGIPTVKMQLESSHLEEGYPGNIKVAVTFSLNNENELAIEYEGETDQATPLSLTNHTYFNLSGFQNTIEQHKATITSTQFLQPDETNIPVGKITKVENTTADLRAGKILGNCFQKMDTGFEHYYTFDKPLHKLAKIASFTDTESGRTLEISTTEPGALFYTGYFTSNDLKRESGEQYGRYRGFCFETSRFPNGPNLPDSPDSLTHSNEVYNSQTIFKITNKPSA